MNNIAIVVVGYNRSGAMRELFKSLNRIKTNREIPLIISIDNNGTSEVNRLSNEYEWKFGPKKVVIHKHKLGLVKHFIWTGDQTESYDTVIFLEDDLLVSPEIVNYVELVSEFYKNDDRVAAASLYNPFINEMTYTRFYQIEDGYDNYFFQQPYWGHVWFKKPWASFHEYLMTYEPKKDFLPASICDWKESFKKIFIQFLNETGKFVVTPRVSYVTNNGIPGLHTGRREECFQSNLMLEPREHIRLSTLDESLSVYDSSYEILPTILKKVNPILGNYDFSVDILGTKLNINTPYVITTKPVLNHIASWSSIMKPIELSIFTDNTRDNGLVLAKTDDVIDCRRFYSYRRFVDINKNYPVGIQTSFQFVPYGFKRLLSVVSGIVNSKKK